MTPPSSEHEPNRHGRECRPTWPIPKACCPRCQASLYTDGKIISCTGEKCTYRRFDTD